MANTPHYSSSVRSGNLIYTSGQLPILDRDKKTTPDGIEKQTMLVLEKVEQILKEYGLTKRHIIKTTAFITDVNDWGKVNEMYAAFFGDYKPARTVLPVGALHYGCLIELEAIASIEPPSTTLKD